MSTTQKSKRLKIEKKITAEQTVILLRLIKKYSNIWDAKHPQFQKRDERKKSFEKIGGYFNLTEEEVRQKYRRLLNSYKQELKQILNGKKTYSNLFYFDEMEFLKEQMEKQIQECKSSEKNLLQNDDTEGDVDSFEEFYAVEPTGYEYLESYEDIKPVEKIDDSTYEVSIPEDQQDQGTRVFSYSEEQNIFEGPDSIKYNMSDVNPIQNQHDEFGVFATFLASQLREMDKVSALETMEELQRIIFKKRISILKNENDKNAKPQIQ